MEKRKDQYPIYALIVSCSDGYSEDEIECTANRNLRELISVLKRDWEWMSEWCPYLYLVNEKGDLLAIDVLNDMIGPKTKFSKLKKVAKKYEVFPLDPKIDNKNYFLCPRCDVLKLSGRRRCHTCKKKWIPCDE